MTWYYWVYIAIAIMWWLDLYSTMIRITPPDFAADVIVKPIFVAFLAAIWPIAFVALMWKQRKAKVTSSD